MSSQMEALVTALLGELQQESVILAASSEVHAGTERLLLRACSELKFLAHHAQQAVTLVLAREGASSSGGVSLLQRPGLLSDCLDWLCVNVPMDELPLQFRPRLRMRATRVPKVVVLEGKAPCEVISSIWSEQGKRAYEQAAQGASSGHMLEWACSQCTYANRSCSSECEICGAGAPADVIEKVRATTALEVAASEAEDMARIAEEVRFASSSRCSNREGVEGEEVLWVH